MAVFDNSTAESAITAGDHEVVLTAVTPVQGAVLYRVHAIVNSVADEAVTYTFTSFKEKDSGVTLVSGSETLDVSSVGAVMTMNGPGTITSIPYSGAAASGVGKRISVLYTVPTNTASVAPDISYLFAWKV